MYLCNQAVCWWGVRVYILCTFMMYVYVCGRGLLIITSETYHFLVYSPLVMSALQFHADRKLQTFVAILFLVFLVFTIDENKVRDTSAILPIQPRLRHHQYSLCSKDPSVLAKSPVQSLDITAT